MLHSKLLDTCSVYAIERANKLCSALLIADGWDFYVNANNAATGGAGWDLGSGSTFQPNADNYSRFGIGKSVPDNTNGGNWKKTGTTNESTWFVATAMIQISAISSSRQNFGFSFYDGGTIQCSWYWDQDGSMRFYRGNRSAEVARWNPAFLQGFFDHYQVKMVIHDTLGEVHVRKNGASTDSFSATGLNTRTTANNYAQSAAFTPVGFGQTQRLDDTIIYNGNVSSAPNDWIGDVRCIPLMPNFDTAQKQFTQVTDGSPTLVIGDQNTGSSSSTVAGRWEAGTTFVPSQGGTFTTMTVKFNGGFTGNAIMGLYLLDGNAAGFQSNSLPGHLIGVASNVVNNPVNGDNTFTFSTAIPVMKGYNYCFAILTDVVMSIVGSSFTGQTRWIYTVPGGYGSGLPADMTGLSSQVGGLRTMYMTATMTATNAGMVSDCTQDDLVTYVKDSTIGDYDLYDLRNLPYTPNSIIGLNLKADVMKSDAGGRGAKIAGLSGATAFETAEYLPPTSFGWGLQQFYPNDPATGSPWSVSAVNALQAGPKVSS